MKHRDPQKECERIVKNISDVFPKAGFSDAIIGLSGGVDSSLVCMLTTQALGKDHIFPMLLPYGNLGAESVLDAMKVIEKAQTPLFHVVRIDIKSAVDAIIGKEALGMENVRKGNIMARIRMIYLFDQAKKRNGLVVGTENRSEYLLGYFTRFGDSASDIEPLHEYYKTEVYELAKHMGIPQPILGKPPSAGLWAGQTDERELGFSYKDADEILSLLFDENKSKEEIIALEKPKELVERIVKRVEDTSFKRPVPTPGVV